MMVFWITLPDNILFAGKNTKIDCINLFTLAKALFTIGAHHLGSNTHSRMGNEIYLQSRFSAYDLRHAAIGRLIVRVAKTFTA